MRFPQVRPGVGRTSEVVVRGVLRRLWDRPGPAADGLVAKVISAARALATERAPEGVPIDDVSGRRQREIILRCDVGRRPQKEVAAELGISRSQFYVERRRAVRRLSALLGLESPRASPAVAAGAAEFEVQLKSARVLAEAGHARAAERALRRVRGEPYERTRRWAAIAEFDIERGDVAAARASLAQAEASARDGAARNEPHWRLARAEIELAASAINWHSGNVPQAMWAASRAADLLRPIERRSNAVSEALVRTLIRAASCQRCIGSYGDALTSLLEASLVLAGESEASASLRAELLISRADTLLMTQQPLVTAQVAAHEAYTLSHRHGLVRKAAEAASELCVIAIMLGKYEEASAFGHQSIRLARERGDREQLVLQHLNTARAEAMAGRLEASKQLLAAARRHASWSETLRSFCDLHRAESLIAAKRYGDAAALASEGRALMTAFGWNRFVGVFYLLESQALAPMGAIKRAANAADTAVTILERHGAAVSLARAYAISGRLTRNRRHLANASELLGALRAGANTPIDQ